MPDGLSLPCNLDGLADKTVMLNGAEIDPLAHAEAAGQNIKAGSPLRDFSLPDSHSHTTASLPAIKFKTEDQFSSISALDHLSARRRYLQ